MRKSVFRFKKFECVHGSGSMKIGVDAVLTGAWADIGNASNILDVGTGCGVIALMCAQRNSGAKIHAIDIDEASVAEARYNFEHSPWSERLSLEMVPFGEPGECGEYGTLKYDLIVSNPPYFDSGIVNPDSARLKARHQDELSPEVLIVKGCGMLSPKGRIAMIVPFGQEIHLRDVAEGIGLSLSRMCYVKGHPEAPVKRVLLEFMDSDAVDGLQISNLTLELSPGMPSDEHRLLCKDFYLKF